MSKLKKTKEVNEVDKKEVLKSKEFNIFWLGFQMGRDMEILNDNKIPELEFALKEYKESKYYEK